MKDIIYRQDAIKELESEKDRKAKGDIAVFYNKIIEKDIEKLRKLPSAQPKIKTGHWIGNYQVDFGEWQEYDVKLSDGYVTDNCHCSECGEELLPGDRGRFCPNCGVKMEKSGEESD